ncbi:MAG: FmdE family protein [Desulfuromonadaceae bacterium]|nr:FmdE family protein [Desulfuromonadaceae bacterium]
MKNISSENYSTLLEEAVLFHGHVCGGIESGTRMAISGLQRIGISDPKGTDRKKLIVFVEIDRCATDAIMSVTGCRPGKRTMKIMDYGKMAATFFNLESGKAVRLVSKARKNSDDTGEMPNYAAATDEELFSITEVEVQLRPEDLPGSPVRTALCDSCGEKILDGRETVHQGKTVCKPCLTNIRYYVPQA